MDNIKKFEGFLDRMQGLLDSARKQGHIIIRADDLENAFPELKESEDERIKETLIKFHKSTIDIDGIKGNEIVAWLEKQGEQKSTDNLTPQEAMDIAVAKCFDEQKSADSYCQKNCKGLFQETGKCFADGDCKAKREAESIGKVKPKFHEGEWVIDKQGIVHQIFNVIENVTNHTYAYDIVGGGYFNDNTEGVRLWSINDAKDGDVLASDNGVIILVKESRDSSFGYRLSYHCAILYDGTFEPKEFHVNPEKFFPATKEQRDLLFTKMKNAGYEWDAEKKELKKIDDEEYNGEDYGIDSLFHAQRILEKTLGKVGGYQSDDGILSHKCAITAVKKLYKQKPAWSEEDEHRFKDTIYFLDTAKKHYASTVELDACIDWLKSLKKRMEQL